jgi:hypothetical protein
MEGSVSAFMRDVVVTEPKGDDQLPDITRTSIKKNAMTAKEEHIYSGRKVAMFFAFASPAPNGVKTFHIV